MTLQSNKADFHFSLCFMHQLISLIVLLPTRPVKPDYQLFPQRFVQHLFQLCYLKFRYKKYFIIVRLWFRALRVLFLSLFFFKFTFRRQYKSNTFIFCARLILILAAVTISDLNPTRSESTETIYTHSKKLFSLVSKQLWFGAIAGVISSDYDLTGLS